MRDKDSGDKGFTLISLLRQCRRSCKGFTLIELMVAIAIIAILATVGMVVYSTAQKSGRISKRIQDLQAIKTALEIYKTANGNYPTPDPVGTVSGWRSQCAQWGSRANTDVIPTATGFIPGYMPVFPADPAMDTVGNKNCYLYRSDGYDYKIMAYQLFDMTNVEIFSKPELVDPRYNNPTYAPAGFTMTFCTGAEGNGDNRAWSLYSAGGRCF